jgi:hypothetical protein
MELRRHFPAPRKRGRGTIWSSRSERRMVEGASNATMLLRRKRGAESHAPSTTLRVVLLPRYRGGGQSASIAFYAIARRGLNAPSIMSRLLSEILQNKGYCRGIRKTLFHSQQPPGAGRPGNLRALLRHRPHPRARQSHHLQNLRGNGTDHRHKGSRLLTGPTTRSTSSRCQPRIC